MSPEYVTHFIPFGKQNAISKRALALQLGCTERQVRKHIEEATKQGAFICNDQDGAGYYQATFEDLEAIKKRYKAEKSRAISLLKKISRMRTHLIENGIEVDDKENEVDGQISLEKFFKEADGQMSFNIF